MQAELQLIAETALTWALSAQGLNLAFAGLCLWAAFGLCPRRVLLISAALYVLLAFC